MQEYVFLCLARESFVDNEVGFIPQSAVASFAEEPIVFDDNRQLLAQFLEEGQCGCFLHLLPPKSLEINPFFEALRRTIPNLARLCLGSQVSVC